MSEETNLNMNDEITAGVDLPESLFDDAEVTAETKSEPEVAEKNSESEVKTDSKLQEEVGATPQTLKLKYNGEEKEISLEEAVQLAQKGMNYDHVMSERDSFKANNEILKKCAKESGLSLEQFMAALESHSVRTAMESEMEKLEEEFPDMSEEAMEELARFRVEQKTREREAAEAEANQKALDARTKPWRDFIKVFPEVSIKDLPAPVVKAIEDGRTPIEAYQSHLIAELQEKNKTAEQTGMNKARSIGSATGDAIDKNKDAFLEGFLS